MEIFLSDGIIVDKDSNEAVGYVPWYDMNEYVQRLFGQNILIAVCSCRALAPTLSDAGAHVGFKYGGIVIYREWNRKQSQSLVSSSTAAELAVIRASL